MVKMLAVSPGHSGKSLTPTYRVEKTLCPLGFVLVHKDLKDVRATANVVQTASVK